nr:uncharacterized protein LOC113711484 [Coffea arabica]
MDLDLALRDDSPPPLTDQSTSDEKRNNERWKRSNRLCLIIIKKAVPEAFRGTMSETTVTAKEFLQDIEKRFVNNEKAEVSMLLTRLISMKYSGKDNIREYIMEMSHLVSKLNALKLKLSEELLVHLILISLPTQFSQFKVSYNCQKETWSLNELISHCVEEEERLKQEQTESAHLVSTTNNKSKGLKRKKEKGAADTVSEKKQQKKSNDQGKNSCFFCGAEGHQKKHCTNYHAWRAKKLLYVDDILLASNDIDLLHEIKKFLTKNFEMKDLGDASFVLGIQTHRDRSRGILELSQNGYIEKCPKNAFEKKEMQKIPYASAVESLMYAQVCTRSDIAYITGMLGRYLSNLRLDHWKATKRVLRYLQKTKDYMLTYRNSDELEIIGYTDSDYTGCQDTMKSTSDYVYLLAGGAISWKSAKQSLIASSTMAAEFIICYEASNQGILL